MHKQTVMLEVPQDVVTLVVPKHDALHPSWAGIDHL